MKKFLSITAVFVLALLAFGLISNRTEANKPVFGEGSRDELENAKRISLDILRDRAARRGANADDFQIQKVEIDKLKMAHTRVRQTVENIPVWEGEAIVHLKSDGGLSTVTDNLKEGVAVSTQPNFSAEDAVNLVRQTSSRDMKFSKETLDETPIVDLWIYRAEDRDHLAYRVEIPNVENTNNPSAPVVFIDAQTGEKIFQYDNLKTGSGSSLYSGTVTISTSSAGSTFYMEDLTRKMGTFNMNNTGNTTTGTGGTQSPYSGTDDV